MSGTQRWRLLLAWHGAAYVGWQRQPNGLSVQEVVEGAVSRFFGGISVTARAAGRLDAGVHSRGQVVVVDVPEARPVQAWMRGLSSLMPPDIACLGAAPCAADFDPRRAASGKRYRYRWLERWPPCPFRLGRLWHLRRPLAVAPMHAAAQLLVGTHDFTSFRAAGCSARSPVRAISRVSVSRVEDEVVLDVWGPAFLRHQVRIMAGTLTDVGTGRRAVASMPDVLRARRRTAAGRTAPAEGLWLEEVFFATPLQWSGAAT